MKERLDQDTVLHAGHRRWRNSGSITSEWSWKLWEEDVEVITKDSKKPWNASRSTTSTFLSPPSQVYPSRQPLNVTSRPAPSWKTLPTANLCFCLSYSAFSSVQAGSGFQTILPLQPSAPWPLPLHYWRRWRECRRRLMYPFPPPFRARQPGADPGVLHDWDWMSI